MSSPSFKENRERLIQTFYARLVSGEQFRTISQARSIAADVIGEPVRPGHPVAKAVEEAIEQAVVLTARSIIAKGLPSAETYNHLVDLYYRQPTLGTRTSTSIEMQAFSTPMPLAYLVGQLAEINNQTTLYEPAAGRGALLMLSNPQNAFVNELDPNRAADLESQGYRVTQHDAIAYRPKAAVDVVVANPPFGRRKVGGALEHFQIGAIDSRVETSEMDQAIVWKALEAMRDNGRAALIIGSERGTDEQRAQKYNTVRVRKFFYNLYRQYKVDNHFTVDGSLYSRQGAAFPVDVIVVKGRKINPYLSPNIERALPSVDIPQTYSSYQALKALLPQEQTYERNASFHLHPGLPSLGTAGEHQPLSSYSDAGDARDSKHRPLPEPDGETPSIFGGDVSPPDSRADMGKSRQSPLRDGFQPRDQSFKPRGRGSPNSDRRESAPSREAERGRPVPSARDQQSYPTGQSHRSRHESNARGMAASPDAVVNSFYNSMPPTPESGSNEQTGQVRYQPWSMGKRLDSYVPQNLERPIQTALENLAREVGSIDDFVADTLNFGSIENMHRALAAEQVDGVALAIRSLQHGKAALIGDDTGLGKGRQMASAIKYAIETGYVPVFITKDPGLYADMARDLKDIGLDASQIRPFMTNSSETIPLPDGRILKTSPTSHQRELNQMRQTEELLPQYNMIFSTYSQLQTVNGRDTDRRRFLYELAPQSILVLDEAHEAGGSSNDVNESVADRATFTRFLVHRAQGVFFASATAIKRPDVASLYAMRMNIADAMSVSGFESTLEVGGTPLQQVASAMMALDGQYIRRARTYDGVEVGSKVVETAHSDADQLSEIMRAILKFDKEKAAAVKNLNKEARALAKSLGVDSSTGLAGAKSTNFTSIMWNVVDQAALARKADAVADYAISVLEVDEKPFIGLSNTMGSFIDQYVKGENIKSGDPIDVSFQDVLARYLERSRDVTIKNYKGQVEARRPLSETELGPLAVEQYQMAEKLINQASFSKMPVSPIDWIRYRIESSGYSFGELTGRQARLEYDADGRATYHARSTAETSKSAKLEIIKGFNEGRIDVGLGNRSASTGYSMHASEKFSDQRRRHFIIAQPERDINVFKQFMGRFHRTGQVNAPKISLVVGNTPDEKRPAAVLAKKLASLNANTTAARQGGIDFSGIPDYLNEVGDQVVSDMMRFDPDLSERLYDPIYVTEDSTRPVEGAVAKVTGCLPILPVVEQEAFYRQLDEEYQATLERYIALGENPLEASNVDLDARSLASVEVVPKKENVQSVFAEGIRAEIVDVKVQSKPKPQLEVINDVRTSLGMPIVHRVEQHDKNEADRLSTRLVEQLHQQATHIVERYRQDKEADYLSQEPDAEKRAGKIDKLEIRTSKQLEILSQIRRFRPGKTVRVTASNERVYYGAITAIKKRGKSLAALGEATTEIKENPVIPSKWEVVIALADAERQISLPLSKFNTVSGGQGTYSVSIAAFSLADGDIYESFDSNQGSDRELRVVMKGNLLRLGDTTYRSKGDLVVATMSNGQPEPVMLMEPGFDINQEMTTSPVVLPDSNAIEQFMQITRSKGVVKTLDEAIAFKRQRSGSYVLQTGRRRKDISQDAALREAAGGVEFVSVADRMEAIIPADSLDAVVTYLKEERGKSIAAFSDHEAARDLLGIEMPEVRLTDTVEAVIEREGLPPSVDMKDLESLREKLTENFQAEAVDPQFEAEGATGALEESAADEVPEQASVEEEIISENEDADTGSVDKSSPSENRTPSLPQNEKSQRQAPLQPPYKQRLSSEQYAAQFLHESGLASRITGSEDFHFTIENEPYIPLVVEAHDTPEGKILYLTHYIEQNGDIFHDGELVYKVKMDGKLLLEDVAARGPRGEVRGYDTAFAEIFSKNIVDQGFAQAAVQQLLGNVAEAPIEQQSDSQEIPDVSSSKEQAIQELPEPKNSLGRDDEKVPAPKETKPAARMEAIEKGKPTEADHKEEVYQQLSLEDSLLAMEPPAEPIEQVEEESVLIVHPIYGGKDTAYVISEDAQPDEPSLKKIDETPAVPIADPSDIGIETTPPVAREEHTSPTVLPPIEEAQPATEKPDAATSNRPENDTVEIPSPVEPVASSAKKPPQAPSPHREVTPPIVEALSPASALPGQRRIPSVPPPEHVPPATDVSDRHTGSKNVEPPVNVPSAPERAVSMTHLEVEKAMRAALYIEDPMIYDELEKLLEQQSEQPAVAVSKSLKAEVDQTRRLANLKFQNELAGEIVPLAHQLMRNAESVGLVKEKGGIKTLPGKHYTVQYLKKQGTEHIKIHCRQGQGVIYAVNGRVQETKGLQRKDRDRFIGFAQKSPQQLRQMIQFKKAVNAGMSQ